MPVGIRSALHIVFPPRCLACGEAVGTDHGLCGTCWRDAQFVSNPCCDRCGTPLPGEAEPDQTLLCDDCHSDPPPWQRGRTALVYKDTGRRLVLALKHADRLDLVTPMARWMVRAGQPILAPEMIVAPVPIHRLRLLKRRYNQSALLAQVIGRETGLRVEPELLIRHRATPPQDGHDKALRLENVAGSITVNPKKQALLQDKMVLLIDDVMTSGATLRVTAEAALAAGAISVSVLTLARVAKSA